MTTNNVQSGPSTQMHALVMQDLMQGADGASGAAGASGSDGNGPPVFLSPEALMFYCQTRLQDIDGQVQKTMLAQQNVNWEQGQIGDLMNEVQKYESGITNNDASGANGATEDASAAKQLETDLENTIAQIEVRDPNCPVLDQLKQLHDDVMSTGTGPLDANGNSARDGTTKDSSGNTVPVKGSGLAIAHGYYQGSTTSDPGAVPNGENAPPGSNGDQDGKLGTNELDGFNKTLGNINNTLNSSAEMGMINIQSQMSQRSTAIQLVTNILQSYDDGLSKIVNNIGGRG